MKRRSQKPVTMSMLMRSVASSSAIETGMSVSTIERKLRKKDAHSKSPLIK